MFSDKIISRLRELNKTQSWLAESLGKSKTTLNSKLKSDKFTYTEFIKICNLLDIDNGDLFYFKRKSSIADIYHINRELKEKGSNLFYKLTRYERDFCNDNINLNFELYIKDIFLGEVLISNYENDELKEFLNSLSDEINISFSFTNSICNISAIEKTYNIEFLNFILEYLKIEEKTFIRSNVSDLVYELEEVKSLFIKCKEMIIERKNDFTLERDRAEVLDNIDNEIIKINKNLSLLNKMKNRDLA